LLVSTLILCTVLAETVKLAWYVHSINVRCWTANLKGVDMKFAFIPKGQYTIGQIIKVHGQPMRVESYTHTGRNVIVHTLAGSPKFKRIVCICTDIQSIEEISN